MFSFFRVNKNSSKRSFLWASAIIVVLVLSITVIVSVFLYRFTVGLLTERLRDRIIAIVSTAAVQFDANDLNKLKVEEDYKKPEWEKVVNQLKKIRENNPDVVFAYIFRRLDSDPSKIVFAGDADSLDPYAKIDLNKDGTIDDADGLVSPGTPYEDVPPDLYNGFEFPTTNQNLYQDQWGWFLSGYAPIRDKEGHSVALVGMDVRANNFYTLTQRTFGPFLGFIIFLTLVITLQAIMLWRLSRQQIDQLEELDRQKDAVLHMVAHQFKGPVTTINFTTELLLDGSYGSLTDEQKKSVSTILAASQKMGSQSEMVLDAAKITLGKLPLEPVSVDLNILFKEVVEEAKNHAKEKKINLKVSLPSSPLPIAILDRKYTQLAIDNLLSNAVKYTALKSAGGNVDFKVEIRNGTLFCAVKDTGIGIPKKDQQNIFKELYRASNAGKDGNGLGLHVTMGAIEAQGGKIRFESIENEGTTFFLELPLKLASLTEKLPTSQSNTSKKAK